MPIALALMLNALRFPKLRKACQSILYMPYFISVTVMVGIIFQLFTPRIGLLSNLYGVFSNGGEMPNIFLRAAAFPHLYVWSGVWQGMGWGTVIYTAALAGVDPTLHEVATLVGASRLQRICHIDLPGILPTISITLILRFGSVMNIGFDKVFLMQNDANLIPSEVISTYVYKVGLASSSLNYSYSTAIGLLNSVIGLVMLALMNFLCRRLNQSSLW